MSRTFSESYFFIEEGVKNIIKIEGHSYKKRSDGDQKEVNARIEIMPVHTPFELTISIPKDDLKKLIVAAKKFLETGKSACFFKDEFHVGEIGNQEKIPAEEALKESL